MIAHPSQFRTPRAIWTQLAKFAVVGSSGYVVNLAVYATLLGLGADFRTAACSSFLVAVANNYAWNRNWTFRTERAHVAVQGARFFAVSLLALGCNLAFLSGLVAAGVAHLPAQAAAIVLATPLSFFGNKLWSFAQ